MRARTAIALAVVALVVVAVALAMARGPTGQAATSTQIEQAVTNGLAWLADQQQADGSFVTSNNGPTLGTPQAATCLALTKFEDRGWELYGGSGGLGPFDPNYYPYNQTVVNGLNYVFGKMVSASGTPITVHMEELYGPTERVDTYTTGACMMALAASREPAWIVSKAGSAVDTWTYQQVLQGMLDWMAGAQWPGPGSPSPQNQNACYTGGWSYYWGDTTIPDNSVTGYATLGIRYAFSPAYGFITASSPDLVTNLSNFISYVQGSDGGSQYEPCNSSSYSIPENILKTGNLLDEMALVGMSSSDPPVANAVSYIGQHFDDVGLSGGYDLGWRLNLTSGGDYQAMFAMMKGLEAQHIDTLMVNNSPVTWFDEVSTFIYDNKSVDPVSGKWYWTGAGAGAPDPVLETSWALLTLEKAVAVPVTPTPAGTATATPTPGSGPLCVPCAAAPLAMQPVPLAGGCNPVVSTYPNGTDIATIAAGVTSTGSFTIWLYSPFTGIMSGYSSANPSNPPSDLTSLNCLDAFYICVSAAGTWSRPLIQ